MSKVTASDICTELENRFLTYALSTIVSRSLPDVRDGLKPIHRRILFAMHSLGLASAVKHVKSAKIIGEVLGKYHPHGDASTYESMVRMAQDFSMRYPLVDGKGNFGSVDGDAPAAYRYTEGRLTAITAYLLNDIHREIVEFRPNYDNTLTEPTILPARLPNLLINGSSGIAVGMACSFPSHNLSETLAALISLIDEPEQTVAQLMKHIKGPDFPTAGIILSSKTEIRKAYEDGTGSIKIRGEWEIETLPRGKSQVIITSIPYSINKAKLIEAIAQQIIDKKLPPLTDVRDESDRELRIVLELKPGTEAEKIMAYLFKHTELETHFPINFTCLKPNGEPERLSLIDICRYFLDFRKEIVTKRLRYELSVILKRLHILLAFAAIFNNLDRAIKLIRSSKARKEAHDKLKVEFKLDDDQVNAILEIPLYRLVSLEINKIIEEKNEKTAEKERIEAILKSGKKIWGEVRRELEEIEKKHGDKRRTKIRSLDVVEVSVEDFVEHEDVVLILSRNGWLRKVKSVGDVSTLKFKENDGLLGLVRINTRDPAAIFTSFGQVYVQRTLSLPLTRGGFGDPVQSLFKFGDGEKVLALVSLAPQDVATAFKLGPGALTKTGDDKNQQMALDFSSKAGAALEALVVSEQGFGFLFPLANLGETTRAGKKVMSLKDNDRMAGFALAVAKHVFMVGTNGKGFLLPREEITRLSGAGAGVRLMKLPDDAALAAFKFAEPSDTVTLVFDDGTQKPLRLKEVPVYNRGSQGVFVAKRKTVITIL
jgi:DNA gyrase subunit A